MDKIRVWPIFMAPTLHPHIMLSFQSNFIEYCNVARNVDKYQLCQNQLFGSMYSEVFHVQRGKPQTSCQHVSYLSTWFHCLLNC